MTDQTAEIRQEMAQTRDRMSRDVEELQARVKQRLDVLGAAREHPWTALGVAVALGAAVSASGADKKLVASTAGAARQIHRHDHTDELDIRPIEREQKSGIGARLGGVLGVALVGALDRILNEMRAASEDWGATLSSSARARSPIVKAAEVVRERVAADVASSAVPVPNEMPPAELGLRANAVEALGGGTHEPPLEPGAGELGARWS